MSWDGAIEPAKIPQFTGDLELLEENSTTLTAGAALFRIEGALVHSDFQGLAAFYETPEADDLFATTKPVATMSDAFADDLEKVATALSDYATEVRPLAAKLERLKDEAVKFCWSEIAGDDDWRQDEDKLHRNNELEEDVKATQLAFWAAEITCHNKITALVGGVQLHLSDDGRTDCTTYGYTADVLDQAELPWGTPAEREYTGWAAFRHNLKSLVWDGFIMDGVVGTAKGLGSLVGTDGWDGMKKSWTGLAKLTTGLALTLSPLGVAYWTMPGDKLPSWLRDSRTAVKETGKALVAYDQWGKNPARAAGAVSFNVITTIATGGAGAAAKSGAAAKAIAAVGKTGRLVDPVMYAVKGSQFAIKGGKYAINTGKIGALKVGDLFNTLKGAGAGGARIKVPGATSTTYTLADEATARSARYADMPEGALPLTDNHGRPAYMDEGGAIRDLDHKPLQLPDEVTKTRNADISTHTDVTSVHDPHHDPVMAGSRAGDGAGETAGRPGGHLGGGAGRDAAGGAASHRPHGPSGGFTHGPSAGHQNPGSGHLAGPGNGDHVPGHTDLAPPRPRGTAGAGNSGQGPYGGGDVATFHEGDEGPTSHGASSNSTSDEHAVPPGEHPETDALPRADASDVAAANDPYHGQEPDHSRPALLPADGPLTLDGVRRARDPRMRWMNGEEFHRQMYGGGQERHYPVPTNSDPKYPVTAKGGRKVDVPVDMPDGRVLAVEVKTYQQYRTITLHDGTKQTVKGEVPLSKHIREQVHKDIALRRMNPRYDPRWSFTHAGPSQELRNYLIEARITFIEYGPTPKK
ncbi:hypothetical protein ACFYO9_14150 [Streptomyces sp. NPDC005863]|uniref:hypothetical protein n=1 Tax=unclassified Streptomyces TaxID=2593676 RepID=UPI0033FA70E6